MKIALLGLGKMGSALARRLLQANFDLTVYNRSKDKMQPLVQAGAKPASTPKEAVANADVVLTCLLDDKAVLETVKGENGILVSLKPGTIHIGTSTILPDTSKQLTKLHQEQGSIYIAGNVLGVPKVADKGELTTIVAGNQNAINQCTAIFNSYSAKILKVGTEPYQANVVKISANYFLVTTIEAMGEIYTFAEKSHVDLDFMNGFFHTVLAHPAFKLYADKIKARDFDNVNFDMKGGIKDLNLFQQAFMDVGVVPDIANIIKNKFIIAIAQGMENKDWSAVTEITREQAGL